MFSCMAARAEREEIIEQVRALDSVVHGESLGGAAADAAVAVPHTRGPPELLPRRGVDLRPRGAGPLWLGAADAAAAHPGGEKRAAARANAGQQGTQLLARLNASIEVPAGVGISAAITNKKSLCGGVDE
jgi:hypothetical protein